MTRPHRQAGFGSRLRGQAGFVSLELSILTVVFFALVAFVGYGWRVTQAAGEVGDAAASAARAVSLSAQVNPDATATAAARAALEKSKLFCPNPTAAATSTTVDGISAYRVTVTCSVPLGDLTLVGIPGTQTISASHVAVTDVFRGG